MPLLRFDLIEGRTDAELQALLDAAHRAMLAAFKVPVRDRYQIVNEHRPSRMIVEDTGLDIPRTNNIVLVTVITRPRGKKAKQKFYKLLVEELQKSCGIAPALRAAPSARFARASSPRLHGVMVENPLAMPMIGFSKSASLKPTARSIARLGER